CWTIFMLMPPISVTPLIEGSLCPNNIVTVSLGVYGRPTTAGTRCSSGRDRGGINPLEHLQCVRPRHFGYRLAVEHRGKLLDAFFAIELLDHRAGSSVENMLSNPEMHAGKSGDLRQMRN